MSVMDVSVVNVALPHMMGSFGRTLSEVTWVATSYSIAEIIMATMAGWFSTLVGRKRLYIASFVVFTAGSLLAGTSQTFTQMLVYRTIQGIGGGALIPVSLAILRETFPPEEQGMAMSLYGMGVVLAPAFGPILGGWLTDQYGWPWIFYVNLPLAVIGIAMVAVFLEDPPYLRRGVARIDWVGIALLTAGLAGLQVVLERGQDMSWFESRLIVAMTIVTAASLAGLAFWEWHADEPVVNLRLLRDRPLAAGSSIGVLFGVALYGSTFILPALLQTLLGYSAYDAGITLVPRAATLFFMMPVAGWLYNRIDVRALMAVGILLIAVSFHGLARLSTDVTFAHLAPILVVMGLGMPFMFVTLTAASVRTVPREHMTEASSLYTLSRRVGGNLGYAVLATVVARRSQFHHTRLAGHLTATRPAWATAHAGLAAALVQRGVPPAAAGAKATALIAGFADQQAGLMAYNDAAFVVGLLFLATLPLVFLFPRAEPLAGGVAVAVEPAP